MVVLKLKGARYHIVDYFCPKYSFEINRDADMNFKQLVIAVIVMNIILNLSLAGQLQCNLYLKDINTYKFELIKRESIDLKNINTLDMAINQLITLTKSNPSNSKIAIIIENINRQFSELTTTTLKAPTSRDYLNYLKEISEEIKIAKVVGLRNVLSKELAFDTNRLSKIESTNKNWHKTIRNNFSTFLEKRVRFSTTLVGETLAFEGWQDAYQQMMIWVDQKEKIDINKIKKLHRIMMNESSNTETFRSAEQNSMARMEHKNADYLQGVFVQSEINYFMSWFESNHNSLNPIELAAKSFIFLSSVHPGVNGNGRLVHLIVDWILLQNNLPPPIFESRVHSAIFLNDPFLSAKLEEITSQLLDGIESTTTACQ